MVSVLRHHPCVVCPTRGFRLIFCPRRHIARLHAPVAPPAKGWVPPQFWVPPPPGESPWWRHFWKRPLFSGKIFWGDYPPLCAEPPLPRHVNPGIPPRISEKSFPQGAPAHFLNRVTRVSRRPRILAPATKPGAQELKEKRVPPTATADWCPPGTGSIPPPVESGILATQLLHCFPAVNAWYLVGQTEQQQ